MLRKAFVGTSAAFFNVAYRCMRKRERGREVVFLSRQADEPSFDYAQLAAEFERRGWKAHLHLQKVTGRRALSYLAHVLGEIRLLGRCRVAVIDRYDPVVSLIDFECEPQAVGAAHTSGASDGPINLDFPMQPLVLQMWHAFGAYKYFGFQSTDTPEGHDAAFMSDYRIHRNCSWVMCSGEGARAAFAEAFSCPVGRVVALDRPEYDELAELRAQRDRLRAEAGERRSRPRVLMAPTLRYDGASAHPFKELYAERERFEALLDADVEWSFHPLESGLPAPGNVSNRLLECDVVVSDYSSIVYEAYLLGIPALFYVPDIESYRESPGLNVDPTDVASAICAREPGELALLAAEAAGPGRERALEALSAFAGNAFAVSYNRDSSTAAQRIADFVIGHAAQDAR